MSKCMSIRQCNTLCTCRLSYLFGISEERFLYHTESILDALIEIAPKIIAMPTQEELPHLAARFDEIGKYVIKSNIIMKQRCAAPNSLCGK